MNTIYFDIIREARFLLDRLEEVSWGDIDETAREFYGHVLPSMARLSDLIDDAEAACPPKPVVRESSWGTGLSPELNAALESARASVAAMTPMEYQKMLAAQRESWVRAFEPCEHGKVDFEQCVDCCAAAIARNQSST